jgi:hypothetical protein
VSTPTLFPAPIAKPTLSQLLDEAERLHELLEASSAEAIQPEDRAAIEAQLIQQLTGGKDKIDRTNAVISNLEGQEMEISREIERLTSRKTRVASDRKRIEAYCISTIDGRGLKAIEGHTSTLKLRRNPPCVVIDNIDLLPAEFITEVTPPPRWEPAKAAIKAAITSGGEHSVPGCRLQQTLKLVRQ